MQNPIFLLKSIFSSIFFDFSKNLFNFKKAQGSRISSPEILIECIWKVFVYSLLLKKKKYSRPFWAHQIHHSSEHKTTFFRKIPSWFHIVYQRSRQVRMWIKGKKWEESEKNKNIFNKFKEWLSTYTCQKNPPEHSGLVIESWVWFKVPKVNFSEFQVNSYTIYHTWQKQMSWKNGMNSTKILWAECFHWIIFVRISNTLFFWFMQ